MVSIGRGLLAFEMVNGKITGMMGNMTGGMMTMGALGLLLLVVIFVAVVLGVVWLVRRSSRGGNNRAMDTLQERFANGEIDAEEYRSRKRELQG